MSTDSRLIQSRHDTEQAKQIQSATRQGVGSASQPVSPNRHIALNGAYITSTSSSPLHQSMQSSATAGTTAAHHPQRRVEVSQAHHISTTRHLESRTRTELDPESSIYRDDESSLMVDGPQSPDSPERDDDAKTTTRHVQDLARSMRGTRIDHANERNRALTTEPEEEEPMNNPYQDKHPHPSLAPEDVIEIQLGAMKYNELPTPDAGIEICFRFASPANRMYTGPVSRFQRMIHNPLYECMINYDSIKFIPANPTGTKWRLAITKAGVTTVFLWSLSKQVVAPYQGCRMTDNVLLVQD